MQDELPLENMMRKARKSGIGNTEVHSFVPFANTLFSFKNCINKHVLKGKGWQEAQGKCLISIYSKDR